MTDDFIYDLLKAMNDNKPLTFSILLNIACIIDSLSHSSKSGYTQSEGFNLRDFKVKFYKEKPRKISKDERKHLYYLDQEHKELIKIYNELSYDSKIAMLNEIYKHHDSTNISEKYTPYMFSVDTSNQKHFVNDEQFKLLYLFFTLPIETRKDILTLTEQLRLNDLKFRIEKPLT